jgi:hypothetical protein
MLSVPELTVNGFENHDVFCWPDTGITPIRTANMDAATIDEIRIFIAFLLPTALAVHTARCCPTISSAENHRSGFELP